MTLADDLLDKQGHVLLPAGVTLTAGMLKSLAQHSVQQLSIAQEGMSEQEQTVDYQKKLDRLAILFRQGPYEGPTGTLQEYIYNYRRAEAE
ncbi:hypothetical protein GCM10011396_36150 [Undibacterium terreum]|uniref:Uncharacterized protein n=2 Tax=Undibacterium terreum TaxID=1224302 RepID=A0A916USH9_9BURK|nr:hypothetical protein GCM10011396_36150 [Undibacterium terreum]